MKENKVEGIVFLPQENSGGRAERAGRYSPL